MIIERIKNETKECHRKLELAAGSSSIMNGELTLNEYKDLLIVNYIFNHLIEKQISRFPELINDEQLDVFKRIKTDWLKDDLNDLNIDATKYDNYFHPKEIDFSYMDILACLYLSEGSTLGGQVINRALKNNPKLNDIGNTVFYNGYGIETGTMWKNFLVFLVKRVNTENDENDMIEATIKAYTLFESIFKKIKEFNKVKVG